MISNSGTVHPIELKFIHHFCIVIIKVLIAGFLDQTFCFRKTPKNVFEFDKKKLNLMSILRDG